MTMKHPQLRDRSERTRRAIRTEVSDREFNKITELAEAKGMNKGEYVRTAIEYYSGEKIFRPRCSIGANSGVKNVD